MPREFDPETIGLPLKEYLHWTVYLSNKQHYLGRLKVVAKRNVIDEGELTPDEWLELHTILQECKRILDVQFRPDLYNYATLGNVVMHHHWHVIPRYKDPPVFESTAFPDEQWGHPPWPNTKREVSEELLNAIYAVLIASFEAE